MPFTFSGECSILLSVTTTTAMVCVVLMLAAGVIWRLVFGRQLQTKPAPDTIAGEFYEQYREGYRETVCVELYPITASLPGHSDS